MERLSISGIFLAFTAVIWAAAAGDPNSQTITKTFKTDDGMYGVASIAGVTSRNGRVSSVGGVKFYPATGSEDMAYYFPNLKSSDKLPNPISFSKEENGKITSGTIKIGPGSISVSSSARSAFPGSSSMFPEGSLSSKPMVEEIFLPYPLSTFTSRSFDPWFHNGFAFRQPQLTQPRFNSIQNSWPYPSFTPLSFW